MSSAFRRAPRGPRRADCARWGGSSGLFADGPRMVNFATVFTTLSQSAIALPKNDPRCVDRSEREYGVTIVVVYGRLIKQKQYSSAPPEPSPGGRKCSLSTMWL